MVIGIFMHVSSKHSIFHLSLEITRDREIAKYDEFHEFLDKIHGEF